MNTEELLRLSLAVIEEHLGVSVYDLTRYAADYWDELCDTYYEPQDSEEENQKRKAHYQQNYEQCQVAYDKLREA